MKKLLCILFLVGCCGQTMAMGYPQSLLGQRKVLIQKGQLKVALKRNVQKKRLTTSMEKLLEAGISHLLHQKWR